MNATFTARRTDALLSAQSTTAALAVGAISAVWLLDQDGDPLADELGEALRE